MNNDQGIFRRLGEYIWSNLGAVLVGSVSVLVGATLSLGALYWSLDARIAAVERDAGDTHICQSLYGCSVIQELVRGKAAADAHIAGGQFVRDQVRENTKAVQECLINCQPKRQP